MTGGGAGVVGFGAVVGLVGVGVAVVDFVVAGLVGVALAGVALTFAVADGVPAAVGAVDDAAPAEAGRLDAATEGALDAAAVLALLTRLLSGGAARRWWPPLHAAVMSARAAIAVAVPVARRERRVRFIPHLRPGIRRSEAIRSPICAE